MLVAAAFAVQVATTFALLVTATLALLVPAMLAIVVPATLAIVVPAASVGTVRAPVMAIAPIMAWRIMMPSMRPRVTEITPAAVVTAIHRRMPIAVARVAEPAVVVTVVVVGIAVVMRDGGVDGTSAQQAHRQHHDSGARQPEAA